MIHSVNRYHTWPTSSHDNQTDCQTQESKIAQEQPSPEIKLKQEGPVMEQMQKILFRRVESLLRVTWKECYHMYFPGQLILKSFVRQPCSATLEIDGKTYSIISPLPALLRAMDEQRSPKAKLDVIEFAVNSFDEHTVNAEVAANIDILNGGLLS
ncbi:hypothetical protein KIW84_033923 [Lathyrus oleraceus]|nr:hypothetical protein KIW84_033923 [Pisum sativum]